MKLDKVIGSFPMPMPQPFTLTVDRTTPARSNAMSSSPSRKSHRTPWPLGKASPSHRCRSPVADRGRRMIAIFDEDGGGDVDFQEFVSGLSAFSSKGNQEEKLRFAFKVYDIDRDGYISNGELFIVLKMMVGSNLKDQQLQQVGRSSLPPRMCLHANGMDRLWTRPSWKPTRTGTERSALMSLPRWWRIRTSR